MTYQDWNIVIKMAFVVVLAGVVLFGPMNVNAPIPLWAATILALLVVAILVLGTVLLRERHK